MLIFRTRIEFFVSISHRFKIRVTETLPSIISAQRNTHIFRSTIFHIQSSQESGLILRLDFLAAIHIHQDIIATPI